MLISGLCDGGPLGGKTLHHGEPIYRIGRDRHTKRIIHAWRGGSTVDVEVGHYEWIGPMWMWRSPA